MGNYIKYNTGDNIGELIFIKNEGVIKNNRTGKFKCYCGEEFITRLSLVKNGGTTSCGCKRRSTLSKLKTTHGMTDSIEYSVWEQMKHRCNNPNSTYYLDYGGRGIKVCDGWNTSFECFYNDMGKRPSLKHTLDRIDNNKGYLKENCRWATKKEQANNKRSSLFITYNGKIQTLKQWSEELGIKYKRLHKRIHYYNWSVEDAFTVPPRKTTMTTY